VSEGGIFLCSWRAIPTGYRVWVRNQPGLTAEGKTLEAANEELADVICGATGDGESIHEYEPPWPEVESEGLLSRLRVVSGGSWGRLANAPALFADGLCPQCHRGRGPRTTEPLALSHLQKPCPGGGTTNILPGRGPALHFYSRQFVELLDSAERDAFEWRPIVPPPRTRNAYYELVGARTAMETVALVGGGFVGERCDTCGYTNGPAYLMYGKHPAWLPSTFDTWSRLPFWFVSVASLPDPLPSIFAIGSAPRLRLGFRADRWRELVGKPGAAGISSADVGVVRADRVEPNPPAQSLAEVVARYR
jgi:hypothetical protein